MVYFRLPGGGDPGAIATNMRDTVPGTDLSVCKTSAKSVQQFRKCVPNRHTDRQTAKLISILHYHAETITTTTHYRLLFRRLQSVQNAAARLITGIHGDGIISLRFWGTSIGCRFGAVSTKLALLVYKSLHGLAPSYLADDCILASSDKFRCRLRSADVDTCIVPRTRTRFGDRSFSAAGPRIWNSLPPELRRPDTELGEFRRSLKTFLFA